MYKVIAIIVAIIMLISAWFVLDNVYNIDVANLALEKIKTYPVGNHIVTNIAERTILGIFYVMFIFSLVIVPGPLELTYLAILATSTNQATTLVMAIIGVLLGQIVNYGLGRIVSRFWQPEPKMKERINKFGGWFIFAGSIVPFLPSQLLNFAAGTVSLPFRKWLTAITIGVVIYFTTLTLLAKQLLAFFS